MGGGERLRQELVGTTFLHSQTHPRKKNENILILLPKLVILQFVSLSSGEKTVLTDEKHAQRVHFCRFSGSKNGSKLTSGNGWDKATRTKRADNDI